MAEALSLQVVVKCLGSLSSVMDMSTASDEIVGDYTKTFSNGAGANQANMLWHDRQLVIENDTASLDLAGGLTSAFGTVITFTSIKGIVVQAATTNINNLEVLRPAANGVLLFMASGDGISLSPGDLFVWLSPTAAGKTVTAGTGDLLSLHNTAAGSSVSCDIYILGTVA